MKDRNSRERDVPEVYTDKRSRVEKVFLRELKDVDFLFEVSFLVSIELVDIKALHQEWEHKYKHIPSL